MPIRSATIRPTPQAMSPYRVTFEDSPPDFFETRDFAENFLSDQGFRLAFEILTADGKIGFWLTND